MSLEGSTAEDLFSSKRGETSLEAEPPNKRIRTEENGWESIEIEEMYQERRLSSWNQKSPNSISGLDLETIDESQILEECVNWSSESNMEFKRLNSMLISPVSGASELPGQKLLSSSNLLNEIEVETTTHNNEHEEDSQYYEGTEFAHTVVHTGVNCNVETASATEASVQLQDKTIQEPILPPGEDGKVMEHQALTAFKFEIKIDGRVMLPGSKTSAEDECSRLLLEKIYKAIEESVHTIVNLNMTVIKNTEVVSDDFVNADSLQDSTEVNPTPNVVEIEGLVLSEAELMTAFQLLKIEEDNCDLLNSAKILFDEIFKDVNICNMGLTIRKPLITELFPEGLVKAFFAILAKMKGLKKKGLATFDLSEQIDTEEWSKVERDRIKNDIFSQHRSYASRKRKTAIMKKKSDELVKEDKTLSIKIDQKNWELIVSDGRKFRLRNDLSLEPIVNQ